MDEISFSVVGGGNSNFLRAFSVPLAEELEEMEGLTYRAVPCSAIFEHDPRLHALDIPTAGIFGVLLFLPGWLAVKVLGEVYDIKIKPVVRNLIHKADSIEILSSRKRNKVFTLEIFLEEKNVLVILAAKEKALEQLESSTESLPNLLPAAMRHIEENGCHNEVHLYVLSEGEVNLEPHVHECLQSAQREINT